MERQINSPSWESLNGGLANKGLRYMSTIVHDCRHFATKVPLRKGPKKATKCTIVDECAQIAESGLKPSCIWSPHLDFVPTQIFLCICFRSDHVGHAQATTAGHTYEIK